MTTYWDDPRIVISCDTTATISAGAFIDGSGLLFEPISSVDLTMYNSGTFKLDLGGPALELFGKDVTYVGNGGPIDGRLGSAGLKVKAEQNAYLTVAQDISSVTAIDVYAGADTSIMIESGSITAIATGIRTGNPDGGRATIEVAKGASVKAFLPIEVVDAGSARIVVAGTVAIDDEQDFVGDTAISLLTTGVSEVELRSGYSITGKVGDVLRHDALIWGGDEDAEFELDRLDDQYFGFDTFTKDGAGAWTLNGQSAKSFQIDIASGTLRLDAASGLSNGTIKVLADGLLGGTGFVNSINASGTVSPGNSIGTLTTGDITFQPGSTYQVETAPADSDRIVADRAILNGGRVQVVTGAGTYEPTYTYTILTTTNGVAGRFDDVRTNSAFFSTELIYPDSSTVKLVLTRNATSFSSLAATPAQKAVAQLFDALGQNAPNFDALAAMNADQARDVMDQMAGTGLAASGGALMQAGEMLGTAALGRVQQQASAIGPAPQALGYNSFSTQQWAGGVNPSLWGRILAGTSTVGGTNAGSVGLLAGADGELEDWLIGFMVGAGTSSVSSGNTRANSADFSAGLYGARDWDLASVRFGGSVTYHAVGTTRTVTAPGINDVLTASYGAATAQVFGEIAHQFEVGPFSAEIFGDIGYSRHFVPGFSETGGASALTVAAATSDAIYTIIGLRADQKFSMGTTLVIVRGTLGWKHTLTNMPATTSSFSGGTPFQVAGTTTAGDALLARAEASFDLSARSGLDLAYDFELGTSGTAQSISARYAVTF